MSLIVIDLNIDDRCSIFFYFAGGKIAQRNRDGLELLKPFISARRNEGKEEGTEEFVSRTVSTLPENSPPFEQNDFLTWLINDGKGEDREDWSLAVRTFGLNFAAIHSTSMVSQQPNHNVNTDSHGGPGGNACLI